MNKFVVRRLDGKYDYKIRSVTLCTETALEAALEFSNKYWKSFKQPLTMTVRAENLYEAPDNFKVFYIDCNEGRARIDLTTDREQNA